MKRAVKTVKGSKRLTALLIVVVTVLYLGITAAVAQNSTTSNNGAKVAYDPDYLSLGDMYAFTETAYESSNYGLTNTTQTVPLYNSKEDGNNKTTNWTFYQYYGSVTTGDHSNVGNDSVKMENHAYTDYHKGYAKETAPAAVEGESVPVLTTTGTGVYTLVPGSTGSYRLYVYSESNPSGKVEYELIDSYQEANAYAGKPTRSLTFTQVAGTNYWYAPITVDRLSWSAYHLSAARVSNSVTKQRNDTNGGITFTGNQKTNTTLDNSAYYYNEWTATEILYDTLLVIQWDASVKLAPITKAADAITITNSDASMGSLTAVNAFGETVAVGSAATTVHAPIYITAIPASDEYAFSGFSGAEVSLVDAEQGIYKYGFESAATLTGTWAKKEHLPTVRISGGYTGTMDFFAATTATTQIVSGTVSNYTLTVDYTGATDTRSVTYTVTSAGTTVGSGTITESSNTIQVSAQWDAVTVSITATGASGSSYTAKFTVNVSNAGLVDVAQIGTTKYQYIEDALAAATSGQTITILSSKVSFVDADTVPAAWTADGNGDGAPDGYTVKSGVKLVIPYSNTGSTTPNNASHDYPYSMFSESAVNTNALATSESFEYRKLTVPAGKTLYVKGQVNTGGTISSIGGVAGATNGSSTETYSVLELNGAMEVQNGGIVSSCGYIYGSGTLTAQSGAKLYQPLVICDFRGGGYTVAAAGGSLFALGTQSGEKYVSPFTRYVTQNIQCAVKMDEGALMYGYSDLYTQSTGGHNRTTGVLVGSTSKNIDGLIKLNTGATLTATYDKDDVVSTYNRVGRMDITIDGGASFGILSLTTQGQTIKTNELTFPIPYNYGFYLNGMNSIYTIAYSMALLPGATLEVGEGATLNVGNNSSAFRFIAFDGFYDHTNSGNNKEDVVVTYGKQPGGGAYPTTAALQAAGKSGTSDLIVNGTLNINKGVNFGGVVQAGSEKALLNMNSAATPRSVVQMGLVGKGGMGGYYFAGATVRELTAEIIDKSTGKRTEIVSGQTYYGAEGSDTIADYTYKLYTTSADTTSYKSPIESLNATVEGSWYNYTATVVTMDTENNRELSRETGYFCVNSDMTGYYADSACTQQAPALTGNGTILYTSSNNSVAKVVWADGVTPDGYYPSLRNAVQAAVHAGDRVVLLKDITQTAAVAVNKAQDITIDLAGHTISYSTTPIVNSGTLTLDLNGGSITNEVAGAYAVAEAFTNNKGATATVDLKGGSIVYQYSETLAYGTQVIRNVGALTVTDTGAGEKGTLTSTASSSTAIASAGATENFAAVLRNAGSGVSLTVKNVKLVQGQTANNNSVGIVNHNGARISELTDVEISCPNGYAVFNLGGTIDAIQGSDLTGYYGIYNRNIRQGAQNTGGFSVSMPAAIESITDTQVTADNQYALFNGGKIGIIGGSSRFEAPKYAVYNHNGWYYDSNAVRYSDTKSSGQLIRTTTYEIEKMPTIDEISGTVVIKSTSTERALQNNGRINTISGNAAIEAKTNYALICENGGSVGTISGNVTITAVNYALQISGGRSETLVTTYNGEATNTGTYASETRRDVASHIGAISGDMAGGGITIAATTNYAVNNVGTIDKVNGKVRITSGNQYGFCNNLWGSGTEQNTSWQNNATSNPTSRTYDVGYFKTRIQQIGGENSQIEISAKNYALYNYGDIETIGDGVTISTSASQALRNGDVYRDTLRYTLTNLGENGTIAGRYDTLEQRKYSLVPARIATISGNVSITAGTDSAIYNAGLIEKLGSGLNLKAASSTVNNTGATKITRDTFRILYGTNVLGTTQEISETEMDYVAQPAEIRVIDGIIASTTTGAAVFNNGGKIGEIINSELTAKTDKAISNTGASIQTYTVQTQLSDRYSKGADGKYTLTKEKTAVTEYVKPVITTIGDGNTIMAPKNTVFNSGSITAIGGEGTGKITTIDASTEVALYNYRGTIVKRTTVTSIDGKDTNTDVYGSADIGMIKNVQITGVTCGIKNGDGNSAYQNLVIGELGKGLIVTATGTTGYGVDSNANYATIALISGGDYKSGNTSATSREYAIRKPNEQTYPADMSLSKDTETVTLTDGSRVTGYYYITDGKFVAVILENEEISNRYPSLQAAVAGYPQNAENGKIYIQMAADSTEPGFTIDRNVYLDLNGKTVTLTSADDSAGTLSIADGVALHGMDNMTNGYEDTAYGRIIGTVTGNAALTYQTPARANGTFERYVKIQDAAGVSFHRYNISVSGYRFDFNENRNSALYFQGTFSGSDTVKNLLKDVGFRMDGEDVWWTAEAELSDLTEEKYVIQIALVGNFTEDELKTPHTVYALADFVGDQLDPAASDPKTLSFWEALQRYYEELKSKTDRSPEEETELAVLEQVLNGTQSTEEQGTDD